LFPDISFNVINDRNVIMTKNRSFLKPESESWPDRESINYRERGQNCTLANNRGQHSLSGDKAARSANFPGWEMSDDSNGGHLMRHSRWDEILGNNLMHSFPPLLAHLTSHSVTCDFWRLVQLRAVTTMANVSQSQPQLQILQPRSIETHSSCQNSTQLASTRLNWAELTKRIMWHSVESLCWPVIRSTPSNSHRFECFVVLGKISGWVARILRGSPFHLGQTEPNTSKPIRANAMRSNLKQKA